MNECDRMVQPDAACMWLRDSIAASVADVNKPHGSLFFTEEMKAADRLGSLKA